MKRAKSPFAAAPLRAPEVCRKCFQCISVTLRCFQAISFDVCCHCAPMQAPLCMGDAELCDKALKERRRRKKKKKAEYIPSNREASLEYLYICWCSPWPDIFRFLWCFDHKELLFGIETSGSTASHQSAARCAREPDKGTVEGQVSPCDCLGRHGTCHQDDVFIALSQVCNYPSASLGFQ